MKFNMFVAGLLASVAMVSAPAAADAATIDFSDVGSGDCAGLSNPTDSQGFRFTDLSGGGLYMCNAGVIQNNTTPALIAANVLSVLGMADVTGAEFSLNSFFAGGRTTDFDASTPNSVTATGLLVEGTTAAGTVSQTFSFTGVQFSQFTLDPSFTGLTSVRFTALGDGAPEFLINNLVVNETAGVPEPATWALMLTGFGGAGAVLRRRRAVAAAA